MNTLQAYDSLIPIIKYSSKELDLLVDNQVAEILESGSSEQSYAALSKFKKVIVKTLEGIKSDAISQINKGNNSAFGVSMKTQCKTTYEYDHDPTWLKLKKALTDYEELMKDKLGKYANMNLVDEEGELKDVKPAVRKQSEFIKTEF